MLASLVICDLSMSPISCLMVTRWLQQGSLKDTLSKKGDIFSCASLLSAIKFFPRSPTVRFLSSPRDHMLGGSISKPITDKEFETTMDDLNQP